MGWNTGILLFESTPAEAVQAALLPRAVPTGREQSVGEALGSREAVVGLGTWQQHTYLIDRYRALELTSQAANDPATNEPLAQLAGRVLVAYLHEVSGSYGLALFEQGQRTMAFYAQGGQVQHHSRAPDLAAAFAALPPPTDGDRFFQYIDLFMGQPFTDWAYSAPCFLIDKTS
jgi:hypothetical protein